jgi:hypothetical protein
VHDEQHHEQHHHEDAGRVHARPVVLDVGGRMGALIVHTDPELIGAEVEISPAGDDRSRQHKQVLLREIGSATVPVLVYDNLPAGEYTLWLEGVAKSRNVRVPGGAVAELDWRG